MRVDLEPSFIIHSRPYRETSTLVYALTEEHGIVHMICRGAKKKGNNAIQPFSKMLLSWSGRGELVTLTKMEVEYSKYTQNFRAQVQCFYLHELIIKLMPKLSPSPELYQLYENTLTQMSADPSREDTLRFFEVQLLDIIGHPLQLDFDCQTEEVIDENAYYLYEPDVGPVACKDRTWRWNLVKGTLLHALGNSELDAEVLPQAKTFLRGLMHHYLGGKPLATRQLLKVN